MKTIELFEEDLTEGAILFNGCSSAIVGRDHRGFAVYHYTKLVEIFTCDNCSIEDAEEYVDFNIIGIHPQNYTILYT